MKDIKSVVCPGDSVIYKCNIVQPPPKGLTVWTIETKGQREERLYLDQIVLFRCAYQTFTLGPYTAKNDAATSECTKSNLTVKASANINGNRVCCINVGGAYTNTEGSGYIYVAEAPNVTVTSTTDQLIINVTSMPPQATDLVYFIDVHQGNEFVLNETFTNSKNFSIPNLIPNTEYTITVNVTNCSAINPVKIIACTKATAPSVDITYTESGIPFSLTWADLGGCTGGYQIQLTTDTGSKYSYNVQKNLCFHNCSTLLNLSRSFEYYIINASSITDGVPGQSSNTLFIGTNSFTLSRTPTIDTSLPVCPERSYNYFCSNTDLVPGNTIWKFPSGSCPCQNNTIILTRNAADNCSTASGTCGNFTATNSEPLNGFCLTSVLSAPVTSYNNGLLIECSAQYDNSTHLEGNATLSIVLSPELSAIQVLQNYTELVVELSTFENSTSYAVELVNATRLENVTRRAIFSNLLPNTRYGINVIASNCAGTRVFQKAVCTLAMPPANVTAIFLEGHSDTFVIYWEDMGGCVSKYRVRITTEYGDVVIDDDKIMSCSHLVRLNETTNNTAYHIQVYSITDGADKNADYSEITLLYKGKNWIFQAYWVSIGCGTGFSAGLCVALIVFKCWRAKAKQNAAKVSNPSTGTAPYIQHTSK